MNENLASKRVKGETLNIVICFDGTGGNPEWADQTSYTDENGNVKLYINAGGLSNISKLHLLAGGDLANKCCAIDGQISLYYQGVGTWGQNNFKKDLHAAFDAGEMKRICLMAYDDLKKIYQKGDKLYVFGFSRGAAAARLFVSYLDKAHLNTDGINLAEDELTFLGVFDTVVASFSEGTSEEIEKLDVHKKYSGLPLCVKRAVHFVSLDERREPFKPTLFKEDERVLEVWCPGNHSDIGGGYYHDGLSDITLTCMRKEAEKAGMKTRDINQGVCERAIQDLGNQEGLERMGLKTCFYKFDKDLAIKANASDPDVHDECKGVMKVPNFIPPFFKYRDVCKMVKDENSGDYKKSDEPVLLLDSTHHRMKTWKAQNPPEGWLQPPYSHTGYNPENLKGVKYKVVNSSTMDIGDEIYDGLPVPEYTARSGTDA